jgi:hypothetical protein
MKYLVLYIILILILYMVLKLSCYKDKKNILYNEKDIDLNLQIGLSLPVEKFDVRAIPSLDITSKEVIEKKSKFPSISTPSNITLEKFIPLDMFYGNSKDFYDFDYAKYDPDFVKIDNFTNKIVKPQQFVKEDNITINSNSNIPFLVDTHKITEEDRIQINIENKYAPRIVESYDEVKKQVKSFGLVLSSTSKSVEKLKSTFRSIKFKSDIELPTQFNGIKIWEKYLSPITNQGSCGNCWAHASSSALADRFAILSLGKIKFEPSPYELTVCSTDLETVDIQKVWKNEEELQKMDKRMHNERSCNGNNLYDTAASLFTDGVTEVGCFPDKFNVNGKSVDIGKIEDPSELPYCYNVTGIELDTCSDGKTPMRKYRCKTAYLACKDRERADIKEKKIMYDLYKYGPMILGFILFPDFMYDYDGKSIYTHPDKSGGELGGHAVRLVGWGEETVNGQLIKYWWIANSWGTDWGINGYFKMKRGISECQLEDNIMSFIPEFTGMTIDDPNLEPVEELEKEVRDFTGHVLDKTTGYYETSIEKIKNCTLRGKLFPYMDPKFIPNLPVYKEFFAGKVNEYISSKNIDNLPYNNDVPFYYCEQDYTPPKIEQPPVPSQPQPPSQSQIQQQTTPSSSQDITHRNVEENIVCKITNSKYFDVSYFAIMLSLGFGFYYLLTDKPNIKSLDEINNKINIEVSKPVETAKKVVVTNVSNNSSFVPSQLLTEN